MKTKRPYLDSATPDRTKRYASDLTDREFAIIAPHVAQKEGSGKIRTVDIREVLNAIFYRVRTGCQWRMLPKDFPSWNHVWYYYRMWRKDGTIERINLLFCRDVREQAGRDPEPSIGIIDSQSVATTQMGGEKGFNPHKLIKGRKRHLLIETLGLILFVVVASASSTDSEGAEYIMHETKGKGLFPRMHTILVDQGYALWLVALVMRWFGVTVDIVRKASQQQGFIVQPQRWKIERTFGWLGWNRLLGKEYERTTDSSETDIYLASIRFMLKRLTTPAK